MGCMTIPQLFLSVCETYGGEHNGVAYSNKQGGVWTPVTYDELRNSVECLSLGLRQLGIQHGDRIGIVSENRVEWVVTDFALASLGAVDVPVFYTLTAAQIEFIYRDCGVKAAVVSNGVQLSKLLEVKDKISSLEFIIIMSDNSDKSNSVYQFEDVIQTGLDCMPPEQRREYFQARTMEVLPNDLLTLIYTSGTTGQPKGVMLTHNNLLSNVINTASIFRIDHTDSFLSYLPLCHSYERMAGYYLAFSCGCTTYFAESIEAVAENMREVNPTLMTSVPRLFDRIWLRIQQNINKEPFYKRMIVRKCFAVGLRVAKGECSWLDVVLNRLADRLVFAEIRSRMGNRLRFFISGGATLNTDIAYFFKSIGVSIIEGYGLTETSPVLTVNREGDAQIGSVGKPLPNVEIRIADDGEILARGPNVMLGYWNDTVATNETIDSAGWLHTGDIGDIDGEGRLRITDRKKDIFVTNGGKNVIPQPIENAILGSSFIQQVVLVGDGRDYCTALIVLEYETVRTWMVQQGIGDVPVSELLTMPQIHKKIQGELNIQQKDISKFERARRFRLLPEPFSIENEMLTPTFKVRRNVVIERYRSLIEEMYGDLSIRL